MSHACQCNAMRFLIVSLSFGLLSHPVWAEKSVVPDTITGAVKVTAEEVISLAENTSDLVIIDSRITEDRIHGYIEGSISLPNTETTCATLAKHVKALNTPTLYYCNGPKCGRSVKAIQIALDCGYTKIFWYRGGFEDWKEKKYPFIMSEK